MNDAAPNLDVSDLPNDPAVLKALLVTERSLRTDLAEEIARLAAIVQAFKRAMFGPRSEKLDPGQLELGRTRSRSSPKPGPRRTQPIPP